MRAIVSNKIRIEEPTSECRKRYHDMLTFPNPEYSKKQQMGFWTGNTPKEISLIVSGADWIELPFGMLYDVFENFQKYERIANCVPVSNKRIDYHSMIKPYDYQEAAIEAAIAGKNGVIVAPCGSGKGLPLDAKIYTPTGWKRNGDLKVGDEIIGSNGKPVRVTNIFDRGEIPAYKLTFSDGVGIVCDKDHLWTVQKQTQRVTGHRWWTEKTEDIYKAYQGIKRQDVLYIPVVKPVEFVAQDVSMNPWLLGFLLGDGCFRKCMISVSLAEEDLRQKIVDIIGKEYDGEELVYQDKYDWRFVGTNVLNAIRKLGLGQKHSHEKYIPPEYKYNSVAVRLSVLQGLFDADGYCSGRGIYEYSTASKQLAEDIVEIVESLGGTAKVKEKMPTYTYNGEKRHGKKSYRIFFKLYDFVPFTSRKHMAKRYDRRQYCAPYRIIKRIEPCAPIISRCITVDAEDQLYVTNHFVVTHNTQIGIEVIARLGLRALWLTHTEDLLKQSMERAKAVLDIPASTYGTITAGRINIGESITFATVQTMCKADLESLKNEWDIIVTDECHHVVGSPTRVQMFYKVISSLVARYKFGLTATPTRSDGLIPCMYALIGKKLYEVTKAQVKHNLCPVQVYMNNIDYMPDFSVVLASDGTLQYTSLINDLTENELRNQQLVADIVLHSGHGRRGLVLTDRVKHIEKLCELLTASGLKCLNLHGSTKKSVRQNAIDSLKAGEIDLIIASFALAREGLDIPNLDNVFFATPQKNEVVVVQSAGRVARKAKGKEWGNVYDYVDSFGMLRSWANKRKGFYKKAEYVLHYPT